MRSHRGFTLIELMVVVAIIGILAFLTIQVSGKQWGANAANISEQVNSTVSFAKLRSVASRRYHRVEVQPKKLTVWQWSQFGMATPSGSCPPNCWELIQTITLPNAVSVWNAQTAVQVAPGASPSVNASLDFDVLFKPDGSSTGATIFITDTQQSKKFRVLVYKATGSSYARALW